MNCRTTIILVACFFVTGTLYPMDIEENDSTSAWIPKYCMVQFAGNLGLVSVGIGNEIFHNNVFIEIFYGYLPKSIHDVQVHTLATKFGYMYLHKSLSDHTQLTSYVGMGINYAITNNTYLVYPDYYPDKYHKANALRAVLFLGLRLGLSYDGSPQKQKWMSIYCEVGTVDNYLYNAIASKTVSIYEIWNLALGLSIDFY
jgi:hypothetical protein